MIKDEAYKVFVGVRGETSFYCHAGDMGDANRIAGLILNNPYIDKVEIHCYHLTNIETIKK